MTKPAPRVVILGAGPAGDAWYRVPVVATPRELPPLLAVFRRLPL